MNEPVACNDADLRGSSPASDRNDKKSAYKKEWVSRNKEHHQALQKAWHEKNKDKTAAQRRAKRLESPLINLRESIKMALKRAGGDITADFIFQMWLNQDGCCALSGIKMIWGGGTGPQNMSIDRIDPLRGYYKDNVRLVCHAINSFRGRMTDEDLLKMALALVSNMQAKAVIQKTQTEVAV